MARVLLFVATLVVTACGQTSAPQQPQPRSTSVATATETTTAAKPASNAARPAWDHDLLALLPQIDACIAAQPDAREITYAGHRDGAIFVRLSSPENNFDCAVRGGVAHVSRRDETLSIDGENAAIFIRGPGENPGGECYQAPEVHDARGVLIGWMVDPEGC